VKLNLGCGRHRRSDCLNVDIQPALGPDLIVDLNKYPYPLRGNRFEHIYALDVVEHLDRVERFMEEAYRLLVPNGLLEITTPHFSSANSYADPTHRQHLGFYSFDYFTPNSPYSFYSSARFEIIERKLVFNSSLPDRLAERLANRYPVAYEKRIAWLWPAWFLLFQLRAVKDADKAVGGDP